MIRLLAVLIVMLTGVVAEPECAAGDICPIASYQYRCPSNPWEECDPYLRFALPGEQFCKLIVYVETGVYTRSQYGEICWRVTKGEHCLVMYPHFVAVYTTGDPAEIVSIYAQYMKMDVVRLPMVVKR